MFFRTVTVIECHLSAARIKHGGINGQLCLIDTGTARKKEGDAKSKG
jgi:hypothetical protein